MAKRYTFTISISGTGETIDEAWRDACDSFVLDPGCPPEKHDNSTVNIEEEEENNHG